MPDVTLPQVEHGIEWLNRPGTVGRSWNPLVGCWMVNGGCTNCYAMTMARRVAGAADAAEQSGKPLTARQRAYQRAVLRDKNGKPRPLWSGVVTPIEEALTEPLSWRKPATVFVNSMSDLFHEDVPFEFIDRVLAIMALTPQHTYLVLTKRPEREAEYFADVMMPRRVAYQMGGYAGTLGSEQQRIDGHELALGWIDGYRPLPNLWLIASVSDQPTADKMIPHLLRCPAVVRGVSYEPALGPVDLSPHLPGHGCNRCLTVWPGRSLACPACSHLDPMALATHEREGIDWLIVGGESGPGARPYHEEWGWSAIEQCRDAGVAVFHKQYGSNPHRGGKPIKLRDPKGGDMAEWPEDLRVREWPR